MDFPQLRKKDLNQKVQKLTNFKERWSIWSDLAYLSHAGNSSKIN